MMDPQPGTETVDQSERNDASVAHSSSAARSRLTLTLVSALVLVLGGLFLFASTGNDDSHLTYWAAHELRHTGQILNINGERIEQSSSVVHVVLLAILSLATGVALPTLGPLTSIAGGVLGVFATGKLARAVAPDAPSVAPVLLVTTAGFVYWSFGGLETTLAAAAFAWLVLAWERHLRENTRLSLGAATLPTALVIAIRPEGPIVLAVIAGTVLLLAAIEARRLVKGNRLRGTRPAIELVALVIVGSAAIFAFRHFYFGAFFPNPVYSKGSKVALANGLNYLTTDAFPEHTAIMACAIVGAGLALPRVLRPSRPIFVSAEGTAPNPPDGASAHVIAAIALLAYLGFIAMVGGDWMGGGRFLAHVAPLLAALALVGISRVFSQGLRFRLAFGFTVAAGLFGIVYLASTRSTGRASTTVAGVKKRLHARIGDRGYGWFEIANLVHLRDTVAAAELGDIVEAIRQKEPKRELLVMSGQAGFVPFHVFARHPGLRLIDSLSLVTRDFVRCLRKDELRDGTTGLALQFGPYFANEESINERCALRRPDILFSHRQPFLHPDYVMVYEQRGTFSSRAYGFLGREYEARYWIAVERSLADRVGLRAQRPYVWDI